jgi:hypothetical protein
MLSVSCSACFADFIARQPYFHSDIIRIYRPLRLTNVLKPAAQYCSAHSSHRKTKPSSRRRGGLISKHISILERRKIWSRVLTGPETKNDRAGETSIKFLHFPSLLCPLFRSDGEVLRVPLILVGPFKPNKFQRRI